MLSKKGIEKHIKVGSYMLAVTENLLGQIDDPRFKLVLKAIYDDEERHHKLLIDLKDKIAYKEKYGEERFWEAIWKDSPWHGAPGG